VRCPLTRKSFSARPTAARQADDMLRSVRRAVSRVLRGLQPDAGAPVPAVLLAVVRTLLRELERTVAEQIRVGHEVEALTKTNAELDAKQDALDALIADVEAACAQKLADAERERDALRAENEALRALVLERSP
jgi:hypothetical protein